MTKKNFIRLKSALAAAVFVCSLALNLPAQTTPPPIVKAEPNYEVVLQVLTASNSSPDSAAEPVPSSLSAVVKRLKTMYSFSNYRVSLTYFQRVANRGNLDFKGVLGGANQDAYAPVFSNFSFGQLAALPAEAGGGNSISIQNFYFGQRVPVKSATSTFADGKTGVVINYEQVGLSMQKIGLPVGEPTIIGNLSASKPDELTFLILTVKPTDN